MSDRWSSLPLWVRAVAIFEGLRLLLIPAFLGAWATQGPNHSYYSGHRPSMLEFLSLSWDGGWYRGIAQDGYPSRLPIADDGTVDQNPWAFFPLFPISVRAVMSVTRLSWDIAAPLTALTFSAVAVVLIAYLVRSAAHQLAAVRPGLPELAVAGVTAFPSAATLGVAYSESTALLLIAAALLLIHRREYWWAILPVVALGFARAVALPMVAVVVWHGVVRWRTARGSGVAWRPRVWLPLLALSAAALMSGLMWPAIAGVVTGRPDAYFVTQSAWRDGAAANQPFQGFTDKLSEFIGPLALPLVLFACVVVAVLSLTRPARRLGPELQSWGGAYLIYLMAVGTLSSSLLRFSLLSITLPLACVAWSRRRWVQIAMLAILVAAQAIWILRIWVYDGAGDAFGP